MDTIEQKIQELMSILLRIFHENLKSLGKSLLKNGRINLGISLRPCIQSPNFLDDIYKGTSNLPSGAQMVIFGEIQVLNMSVGHEII